MHTYVHDRTFRLWAGIFYFEASWWSQSFGLEVTVDPDPDPSNVTIRISPYFFSLYFGFAGKWLNKLCRRLIDGYEPRSTGIRVFDWAIWWDLWHSTHSWTAGTPKWRTGCWHPLDTLFGRMQHSSQRLSIEDGLIPMPERAYACTVELTDDRWKRPRLPWVSQRVRRAHIECPEGVPFPGKGENAWDCGDDASYGLTTPAETAERGIAQFVEYVLGNRRKRGGPMVWDKSRADVGLKTNRLHEAPPGASVGSVPEHATYGSPNHLPYCNASRETKLGEGICICLRALRQAAADGGQEK